MRKVRFLDCTLRDGGYINNWKFGNLTIRSIVARLDAAGVDYIEVGFLDSRQAYDNERSVFPDIPAIEKSLGRGSTKHAKLVAMIDYGTFDESLLIPANQSCLYGIRLIFTKDKARGALEYAKKIQAKGYHLFLNLVSTSSYHDRELLTLIDDINAIHPTAVSIVDTYGLMFNSDMAGYVLLLDRNLDKRISLGYHSHNNLQMSNSNSIDFIRQRINRDIIVDSSILGMGKNAGNACTELMLSYANGERLRKFDIAQVLECAYIDIGKFQKASNWGYRLEYLISAIQKCSPNWTKLYMKNKSLSIKDIFSILSDLPEDKKYLPTYFNPELANALLEEYLNKNVNDQTAMQSLKRAIEGRNLLLVCPGTTVRTHRGAIEAYIEEKQPLIITINFMEASLQADYVWISNSVRYSQISSLYKDVPNRPKLLLTSNITPLPSLGEHLIFNYKVLRDRINGDVSTVLLLELLQSLGAGQIAMAGFDGFGPQMENYFDSGYDLIVEDQANEKIITMLTNVIEHNDCSNITFVTPSRFEVLFASEGKKR